jgi:hypothetical protein
LVKKQYRNKLNEQKAADLKEKKARLLENRENVGDMEIRINELRERLQRKKMLNQQLANQLSDASQKNNKVLSQQQQQRPVKNSVSQVAAIEPFNRQQQQQQQSQQSNISDQRDDDVTDFSKNDPKYQTLPYNTRFVPMNFHNNNNNNNNNKRGSPTMMKSLKVASVPPQVAEKPALPPKPAVNYKPLLPPRQNPDKDSSIDASPQPSSVSFLFSPPPIFLELGKWSDFFKFIDVHFRMRRVWTICWPKRSFPSNRNL